MVVKDTYKYVPLFISPGTVDFNLSAMPIPAKKAEELPHNGATAVRTDNLFNRRRMKGWWPVYDVNQKGTQQLKVHVKTASL